MNFKNTIGKITLLLLLTLCVQCELPSSDVNKLPAMKTIDFQGHRGARGLLPENTIPAFLTALSFPKISTLELDVVVSKDSQIVVSHEPYFSHHISSHPNGGPVTEAESKTLNLYEMTMDEIKTYDVGQRGNKRFPDQVKLKTTKPSFKELVKAMKSFCEKNERDLPKFNIEIKSYAQYYDQYFPQPKRFVALMMAELKELDIEKYVNLQSFDVNVLEEIHRQAPHMSTALLVEKPNTFEAHLKTISFKPTIYSPYFEFVTEDIIRSAKAKGIKVIPWTVNELKDMQRMIDLGVDGLITDYPNRINQLNLTQ